MVDLEERDLEVGADAVRAQQLLDRADQRVLPPRERRLAGDAVEVAERRDVLRQRDQRRPPARSSAIAARSCPRAACAAASASSP